jgi:hypothetical protein
MNQIKPGNYCPLIKKDCIGLKCSWYTQIRGMNPNTGEDVDHWGCAITWLPMLTIENSQQQRSTGAAVESFRNEVVKANQENQRLYSQIVSEGILPATVTPLNIPLNTLESGESQ